MGQPGPDTIMMVVERLAVFEFYKIGRRAFNLMSEMRSDQGWEPTCFGLW